MVYQDSSSPGRYSADDSTKLIKWMRSQGHAVKYALKREEVIDQIRKSGILEKMS
jgi:hypothetical protein